MYPLLCLRNLAMHLLCYLLELTQPPKNNARCNDHSLLQRSQDSIMSLYLLHYIKYICLLYSMSFLISEFTVTNDKKTDETYTETSCYYHRRLHCCTLLSAAATEPRATMLNPKTKETQSKLIWKSYKYQQDLTRDFVHPVRLINSWTKTKYDKATLVAWSWLR